MQPTTAQAPMQLLVKDRICDQNTLSTVLSKTQGHVVIGHGCDYLKYGFVTFEPKASVDERRGALAQLGTLVTPADILALDKGKDRPQRDPNLVVWAVGISSQGYFGMEFPNVFPPDFDEGFAKRASKVTMSGTEAWNRLWKDGKRYDAVVAIAARRKTALPGECAKAVAAFGSSAKITWKGGFVRRDKNTHAPREHFGFVDGVSQPVFFASPKSGARINQGAPAGLGLVLLDELFPANKDANELGSYCAFLSIQQHQDEFTKAVAALRNTIGFPRDAGNGGSSPGPDELIIGRRRDGLPLIGGGACASHTRKMDTRNGNSHRRILRRGVLYDFGKEKGLFFQSFQKSIASQFEFLLRSWANNPAHPTAGCGIDPIAGSLPNISQTWPMQNGASGNATFAVGGLTTIRGGDYFYFPSIPSLKALPKLPRTTTRTSRSSLSSNQA